MPLEADAEGAWRLIVNFDVGVYGEVVLYGGDAPWSPHLIQPMLYGSVAFAEPVLTWAAKNAAAPVGGLLDNEVNAMVADLRRLPYCPQALVTMDVGELVAACKAFFAPTLVSLVAAFKQP